MADKYIFPYQAWTLTTSLKVVEQTIVKESYGDSPFYREWHQAKGGKNFHTSDIFPTREAALQEGWRRLENLESKLKATVARIAKKRATLIKESHASELR